MCLSRLQRLAAVLVLSVCLFIAVPAAAALATPASRVAADRVELDRAIRRLDASRARLARVEARISTASARLDALIDRQAHVRARLNTRVRTMYRTGETTFLAVIVSARTYEDFITGWALLGRINKQDAALIRELDRLRAKTTRTARQLVALQSAASKDIEMQRREVAAARAQLAADAAARAEYDRRVAAAKAGSRVSSPAKNPSRRPKPGVRVRVSGTGAWRRAVASHYGRNFSGRGASGARIGPYSMICAHKTLPFGTLVEFNYGGKRAVAKVVDRGPHVAGRAFDLGPGVVRVLGFSGVHSVRYRVIGR